MNGTTSVARLLAVTLLGLFAVGADAPRPSHFDDLVYPADWPDVSPDPEEQRRAAKDKAVAAELGKVIPEFKVTEATLGDAVDRLRDATGLNIFVNWRSLEKAGVGRDTPLSIQLGNVRAGTVLEVLLTMAGADKARLGHKVEDGVVTISTAEDLVRTTITAVYDIRHIVRAAPAELGEKGRQHQIIKLIRLVQKNIDSPSWRDNGGNVGAIRELSGQLIVTQTPENQERLKTLLKDVGELFVAGEERVIEAPLLPNREPGGADAGE